ncbi:MAG: hypothetical protein MRK00_08215 [Nitrosomonas sp.]|nr:hypothetical protein [Nitrosomonas sp.]
MTNEENSGMETDPEGFLKIDESFILIAGSSDVLEEMAIAQRVVQDVLREYGKNDVIAYVWDIHIGPEGPDQRRTMQRSIPRPSSNECLGVVYIVGERIGLPLEDGFDASIIGGVEDWMQNSRYRLAPEWPDDPDQTRKLLDEGFFPLTGGVFEFLDARGYRSDNYPAGKPGLLCLMADGPIIYGGEEIALNRSRWFNKQTAGMTRAERTSWDDKEYAPQSIAVHNWMRALAERGLNQNPTSTYEELRRSVRSFVTEKICRKRGATGNPYRELEYYDIGHGERFVGRSSIIKSCVAHLLERFADTARVPVVRLVGPSGSGKSSVLRAGILRSLTDPEHRRRFHIAVFRPEDFRTSTGQRKPVVFTILEAIARQAQLAIPNNDIFDAVNRGADAPKKAAEIISNALVQSQTRDSSLVLGLDQFEEIVDMLTGREAGNWRSLLQFVQEAVDFPNIGIVYTLESSRKSKHDQLELGKAFETAHEVEVELTSNFIDEVIRRPFADTGYKLANDVVDKLKSNLSKLQDRDDYAARNSVLPLLALRLYHLWNYVNERFEPERTRNLMLFDPSADAEDAISHAMLNDGGESLDFEDIIQQQAASAWQRAKIGDIKDDALDYFLQPLVGVEGERLQLVAAPRQVPYKNEQALIDSFSRHRLIVGAGDGLIRLVHETVLENWAEAKGWCDSRRDFLVMKERLRDRSKVWESERRPKIRRSKKTESEIPEAAEVLAVYRRHWAFDNADIPNRDRILFEFCLNIFSHSRTPRAPVVMSPKKGKHNHATLAASYGLMFMLKQFLRLDSDSLHVFYEHGKRPTSPLVQAAWGQFKAVEFLLEAGVNPFLGEAGWPPVLAPIQMGRHDIFMALMDAAAKQAPKEQLEKKLACPSEASLLHYAARYDNYHAARDLVHYYNFSPTSKDNRGWMPIHYAAGWDAINVFELLCEYLTDETETENAPNCLVIAAANGSKSILDRVLANTNQSESFNNVALRMSAFEVAVKNYHSECVRLLLRYIDPMESEASPFKILFWTLDLKAEDNDIEKLIETLSVLLADERVDVNAASGPNETTPLGLAMNVERAQRLLLEDPRVNLAKPVRKEGPTGFFVALKLGVWSAVRRYIRENGLPQDLLTDEHGNTVLHLLTKSNAPTDLIKKQINQATSEQLNSLNKRGQTPFTRALSAKNWNLASRMIDTERLSVGVAEYGFQGELYVSLQCGVPDALLRKIVDAFPEVFREADRFGWTILHHIAALNLEDWVSRIAPLLNDSSAWTIEDSWGRRPIDLSSDVIRSSVSADKEPRALQEGRNWDVHAGWHKVDSKSAKIFIKHTKGVLKKAKATSDASGWIVERGALSFYPGSGIFKVRAKSWEHPNRALYFLENGDDVAYLNGESPPIHEFNAKHDLSLNADNTLDYLRFFCFFVRGDEGPFFIFDHMNDAMFEASMSPADRKLLLAAAHPAWVIDKTEGGFEAVARVFYSNALFGAYFFIKSTGMIEMRDDFPLMADLSGAIDMPLI